jgi:hypothetical protein
MPATEQFGDLNRVQCGALEEFVRFDQLLPGQSQTGFLKGLALDGMGKKEMAAREYNTYLQAAPQGDAAGHARQRLTEWGYVK